MTDVKEAIGLAAICVVLAVVLAWLFGCASKSGLERAAGAVTVEQYREALTVCRAEGKDAGSLAVYERCAHEADIHYGFAAALDGGK